MIAGWWRQHELSDGTYNFQDLVDANRVLDVVDENKHRAHEAAAEKRE